MKRRLLAFTLAFTMTFSTLFTVNADDLTDTVSDDTAVSDEISADDEQEVLEADVSDDGEEADVSGSDEEADASDDADGSDENAADTDTDVSDSDSEEVSAEEADGEEVTGGSDGSSSDINLDSEESTASDFDTEETTDAESSDISLDAVTWDKGTDAGVGSGNAQVKVNDDGSVTIDKPSPKVGGKFSEGEDSFVYYGIKDGVDITKNFVFSATMNVDQIASTGESNPAQSSAGMLIMSPGAAGEGGDKFKTPPSVSLTIAMESDDQFYIGANVRNAFDDKGKYNIQKRAPSNKDGSKFVRLSDTFKASPNAGTFDLKIEKLGYSYIITSKGLKVIDEDGKTDIVEEKTIINYPKDNFMGKNGDNTLIYPVFFAARDAKATFSNIKFEVEEHTPTEIVVLEDAQDRTAVAGNVPKLEGLKLGIKYEGTEDVKVVEEGYVLENYDKDHLGVYNDAKIVIGELELNYPVEIVQKICTNIKITSPPMKYDYYEGQQLRTENLVVEADYNDGSHVILDRDKYEFVIKGKVVGEKDFIKADMAGNNIDFVVRQKDTAEISNGGKTDSFKGSISPLKLSSIMVALAPAKSAYDVGDELSLNGLTIKGFYSSADGNTVETDILRDAEIKVVSDKVNMSKVGTYAIDVFSTYDETKTDTFDITVSRKIFSRAYISSYPRTTYPVLKGASDYDAKKWYDYYNGNPDGTMGTVENGRRQYNQANLEITYEYSKGDKIIAPETEYQIILDDFDIRDTRDKNKPNQIRIVFPETSQAYGTEDIILPITVKDTEYATNYWKPAIFGASTSTSASIHDAYIGSNGKEVKADKMGMIFKDANGKETPFDTRMDGSAVNKITNSEGFIEYVPKENLAVTGNKSYTDQNIEEKGTSIRIWALQGAGKAADSNDGQAYYYTRLSTKDNFRLSADFVVHSYVQGDTDENRDGQEGFGIMARDIMGFIPNKDNTKVVGEGKDAKIQFVYKPDEAIKDIHGEPEPYCTSIYNYSNMVFVGGFSGSGWPNDPTADTYQFNSTKNRINLIYRTFIEETPYDASPEVYRSSVTNTLSRDFPGPDENGEKRYHMILERVQNGYKAICYDYQSGEFRSDFIRYDDSIAERDLDVLDPDNLYVGFFASRYADVTVSNVILTKSERATDMEALITEGTRLTTPRIYLKSSIYSQEDEYNLVLRTSNNSGGNVTILQDGKVVYKDSYIRKTNCVFPVKLNENSTTKFTVMYTPSYISPDASNYQELTSYETTYYEYEIHHKGNFDRTKKFIYVSPTGTAGGTGNIDDPMNFDIALGLMDSGQTIILLPGVYNRTEKTEIPDTSSGTLTERKAIVGYNKYQAEEEGYAVPGFDVPDGDAIFDLQKLNSGFVNHADNWTFKNFHIRNGGKNAKPFHTGGDNGIVENIKVYDSKDSGLCVSRTSSDQLTVEDWPTNNLIKNCEVWNCADASFNNSDGFAVKLTVGYGNKLVGCVSHHNSDDGWDLFCKQSGGYMAPVTLEKCITYRGGYKLNEDGTDQVWSKERGGKNGFKMGGDYMDVNNVLIDCIAFENGNSGVTSNSNPLMTIRNLVAYNNEGSNVSLYSGSNKVECQYNIKGLVSYKPQSGKANGGDSIANYGVEYVIGKDENGNDVKESYNKDYNYIKSTSDTESRNASGDPVTDDFFVTLEKPQHLVDTGHFAQDPKTGDFILDGFLELKPEIKAMIQSVPGYEDPEVVGETEETTEEWVKDVTGTGRGGGSTKKGSSSTASSGTSDKTENNKTESDKTESNKTENDKAESNKTESNKTETVPKVTVEADNGAKIEVPKTLEGKVTVNASSEFGGNAAEVKFDSDSDLKDNKSSWVEIPFNGDTSNPDNIVVTFVDSDGKTTIVKASYYDPATGKAYAPLIGSGTYGAELKNVTFADMTGNWAKPYVEALAARGIVNGINDSTFAPNAKIKRGDFVLMLAQVIDINSNKDSGFNDVSSSDYYSGAIAAAKEEGLVKGISDKEFGAKANITRQDVMTIITRTLEEAGVDMSAADISKFADGANVSEYAKDGVAKLVGAKIIEGNNGYINPKDNLTRAEAAKILYEVWKRF